MVRRRKFSDEYKRKAVRLATQPGVTKSQVAQELGINANLLGRWCRDYAANGAAAFPGQGRPRDEEMASLSRDTHRLLSSQRRYHDGSAPARRRQSGN
jgi:transposase